MNFRKIFLCQTTYNALSSRKEGEINQFITDEKARKDSLWMLLSEDEMKITTYKRFLWHC